MVEVKEYAGLIRNSKDLAAQLGVDIAGLSKDERERAVLVAAYEAWGLEMGTHLNGQFALALYDADKKQTLCLRDPLGAELFFYYQTPEGQVLYSTDIKGLFDQPGFKKELNEKIIQRYLGFSYLPGEETLFKGVYKLEPGGYLLITERGLTVDTYWELAFEPDESKSLDDWANLIEEAMEASLRDICDEDAQPDSFLSGGVDSSYILAKSKAKTGYCAGYENKQASEADEARATAQALGRDFQELTVSPSEFLANVDEFLLAFELPTADVAALSLYCACKQIVGKCSLCFSGEGADEFFAGYVYPDEKRMRMSKDSVYFGSTYNIVGKEQAFFLKKFYPEIDDKAYIKDRAAKGKGYDYLSWLLYTDLRSYFEASILYNSTKISRGTGLDIRMPFCDLRIFEISRTMPSRFKADATGNKLALRKAASKVLPHEVAYRKKLGFPVPVRSWLTTPEFMTEFRRAFTSDAAQKYFDVEELKALLDSFEGKRPSRHSLWYSRRKGLLWRLVWTIYTFIRWYELFFEA